MLQLIEKIRKQRELENEIIEKGNIEKRIENGRRLERMKKADIEETAAKRKQSDEISIEKQDKKVQSKDIEIEKLGKNAQGVQTKITRKKPNQ